MSEPKNGINLIYIKSTLFYPRRFAIIHYPIFIIIKIHIFMGVTDVLYTEELVFAAWMIVVFCFSLKVVNENYSD
jgi:hypothetical protein